MNFSLNYIHQSLALPLILRLSLAWEMKRSGNHTEVIRKHLLLAMDRDTFTQTFLVESSLLYVLRVSRISMNSARIHRASRWIHFLQWIDDDFLHFLLSHSTNVDCYGWNGTAKKIENDCLQFLIFRFSVAAWYQPMRKESQRSTYTRTTFSLI